MKTSRHVIAAVKFSALLERHFRYEHHPMFYASAMDMSLFRLNNIVRMHLGKTIYEAIQDRLHQEALHLLMHSSLKVQEIAYELGCCDAAYFARDFRKRTGTSPRAYREIHPLQVFLEYLNPPLRRVFCFISLPSNPFFHLSRHCCVS